MRFSSIPFLQQRKGAVEADAPERRSCRQVAAVEFGEGGHAQQAEAARDLVPEQRQHAQQPRLSPGGVLIIDDYGYWAGARKAVDEYFGSSVFLSRIDETGRVAIKPPR